MVERLIMPKIRHGAAFSGVRSYKDVTVAIERSVCGRIMMARSRAMVWALDLGSAIHPELNADLEVLSRADQASQWVKRVMQRLLSGVAEYVSVDPDLSHGWATHLEEHCD